MIFIFKYTNNHCKGKCCNSHSTNKSNFHNLKSKLKFETEWFSNNHINNHIIDYKLSDVQIKCFSNWATKQHVKKHIFSKNAKLKKQLVLLNNIFYESNEYIIIDLLKSSKDPSNGYILKFAYTIIDSKLKFQTKEEFYIQNVHSDNSIIKSYNSDLDERIKQDGINMETFSVILLTLLKNRTIISDNKNEDIKFLHMIIAQYLFNNPKVSSKENKYWKNYFKKINLNYSKHICLCEMYKIIKHIDANLFPLNNYNLNDICKNLNIKYKEHDNSKELNYNIIKIKQIFIECYKKMKIGKNKWL